MTDRQNSLLKALIENYTRTVEPVASALLAQKIAVSSATVRNELAELEARGYIIQPHTSAGRVPTMLGYQYYVGNFLKTKAPSAKEQKQLEQASTIKELAKVLAVQSDQAVLVALAKNDFFYTGLSHLFAQPEFANQNQVIRISSVLDAFDQALQIIYDQAANEVEVLIGDKSPFSPQFSLLITKNKLAGVLAILGPLRMDYNRNVGLLEFTNQLTK